MFDELNMSYPLSEYFFLLTYLFGWNKDANRFEANVEWIKYKQSEPHPSFDFVPRPCASNSIPKMSVIYIY